VRILSEMKRLLPAWELDINRHNILHLVESIRSFGPPWAWSMWGFERMWSTLKQWMAQPAYPERNMMMHSRRV